MDHAAEFLSDASQPPKESGRPSRRRTSRRRSRSRSPSVQAGAAGSGAAGGHAGGGCSSAGAGAGVPRRVPQSLRRLTNRPTALLLVVDTPDGPPEVAGDIQFSNLQVESIVALAEGNRPAVVLGAGTATWEDVVAFYSIEDGPNIIIVHTASHFYIHEQIAWRPEALRERLPATTPSDAECRQFMRWLRTDGTTYAADSNPSDGFCGLRVISHLLWSHPAGSAWRFNHHHLRDLARRIWALSPTPFWKKHYDVISPLVDEAKSDVIGSFVPSQGKDSGAWLHYSNILSAVSQHGAPLTMPGICGVRPFAPWAKALGRDIGADLYYLPRDDRRSPVGESLPYGMKTEVTLKKYKTTMRSGGASYAVLIDGPPAHELSTSPDSTRLEVCFGSELRAACYANQGCSEDISAHIVHTPAGSARAKIPTMPRQEPCSVVVLPGKAALQLPLMSVLVDYGPDRFNVPPGTPWPPPRAAVKAAAPLSVQVKLAEARVLCDTAIACLILDYIAARRAAANAGGSSGSHASGAGGTGGAARRAANAGGSSGSHASGAGGTGGAARRAANAGGSSGSHASAFGAGTGAASDAGSARPPRAPARGGAAAGSARGARMNAASSAGATASGTGAAALGAASASSGAGAGGGGGTGAAASSPRKAPARGGRPLTSTTVTVYEDASIALAALPPIAAGEGRIEWVPSSEEGDEGIPVSSRQIVIFSYVEKARGRPGRRGGKLPSRFRSISRVSLGAFDPGLVRVAAFDIPDVVSLREVLKQWRVSQSNTGGDRHPVGAVFARCFARAETAKHGVIISAHALCMLERRSVQTWQKVVSAPSGQSAAFTAWYETTISDLPPTATVVLVFSEAPVQVSIVFASPDGEEDGGLEAQVRTLETELSEVRDNLNTVKGDKEELAKAAAADKTAAEVRESALRRRIDTLQKTVAAADGRCPFCRASLPEPTCCLLCLDCCRSPGRDITVECSTHRPMAWVVAEAGRRAVAGMQQSLAVHPMASEHAVASQVHGLSLSPPPPHHAHPHPAPPPPHGAHPSAAAASAPHSTLAHPSQGQSAHPHPPAPPPPHGARPSAAAALAPHSTLAHPSQGQSAHPHPPAPPPPHGARPSAAAALAPHSTLAHPSQGRSAHPHPAPPPPHGARPSATAASAPHSTSAAAATPGLPRAPPGAGGDDSGARFSSVKGFGSASSCASASRHPGFTRCVLCKQLRPNTTIDDYNICQRCQSDVTTHM